MDKEEQNTVLKDFLSLEDFNFDLPEGQIAQAPLKDKTEAKLLWVNKEELKDYQVKDVVNLINKEDLIIFNNTKVIPARLIGKRGEAKIVITLHYCIQEREWLAFAKNSKRLKEGDIINFAEDFSCELLEKREEGEIRIQFIYSLNRNIFEMLEEHGHLPLPPYIKRENINNKEDKENYQSVFAKIEGAVAAPTASLHFSSDLLQEIANKGIKSAFITLHVGAGTFLPVKVENILEHKMHKEYGEISQEVANLIKETKARGGRIIAVGTTSLRVLEYVASSYGEIQEFRGEIDLFIYPSFKFKIVDKLLTNFHLPKSTLFMLVAAFCGLEVMQKAYKYAINKSYRFFSYGDCCFLNRRN